MAETYDDPSGIFFCVSRAGAGVHERNTFRMYLHRHVASSEVHIGLGPCGVDVLLGSGLDAAELSSMFPRAPGECDGQCLEEESPDAVLERRCAKSPDLMVCGRGQSSECWLRTHCGRHPQRVFHPVLPT